MTQTSSNDPISNPSVNKVIRMLGPEQLNAAFKAGKAAKRDGKFRVTPYYEMRPMDHFWFAGYDGKSWQEALDSQ